MTRHVQLDPVAHRDLRVDTTRSASSGDGVMVAPTFPDEFRELHAHYPVLFHVDGNRVQPLALLGLQHGQNLFLDADGWQAHYVPLAIERGPFLIGGSAGERPMVHVDLDHPRLHSATGEALFLPHGGFTPYFQRVQSVLQRLHDGIAQTPAFVDALQSHALLEPFTLDITLDDGRTHRLSGFHIIDETRLRTLVTEAIGALHAAGHLEAIYMAIASASRFRDLIERMRGRLATA